ncbi:MAG TPA: hypothetical protein VKA30_02530 [Actinomycetota bacterium]|nr:hypothetical protein [Actinomycetota bacterium]
MKTPARGNSARSTTALLVILAVIAWGVIRASPASAHARFARVSEHPIMRPTPTGYDRLAITSPSVAKVDGVYYMVYAGWRVKTFQLLGATSRDGVHWTKRATPVLEPSPTQRWMKAGVAEAELRRGSDGTWYVFFTGLGSHDSRAIGIARSTGGPFGPYVANPSPIIQRTGDYPKAIAPSVAIDPFGDGRAILYYSYTDEGEGTWGLRAATAHEPF